MKNDAIGPLLLVFFSTAALAYAFGYPRGERAIMTPIALTRAEACKVDGGNVDGGPVCK